MDRVNRVKRERQIKTYHSNCPHIIGGTEEEEHQALRLGFRLCHGRDLRRYGKPAIARAEAE